MGCIRPPEYRAAPDFRVNRALAARNRPMMSASGAYVRFVGGDPRQRGRPARNGARAPYCNSGRVRQALSFYRARGFRDRRMARGLLGDVAIFYAKVHDSLLTPPFAAGQPRPGPRYAQHCEPSSSTSTSGSPQHDSAATRQTQPTDPKNHRPEESPTRRVARAAPAG
jgi:hypothetical protein